MPAEANTALCMSCGGCVGVCPLEALELERGTTIVCNAEKCTDCGICVRFCPVGALSVSKKELQK